MRNCSDTSVDIKPFRSSSDYVAQLKEMRSSILSALKIINESFDNKVVRLPTFDHVNSISVSVNPEESLDFESVVPLKILRTGLGINIRGLNKQNVLCLIDSGAMENCLPAKFINYFKMTKLLPKIRLKSASNNIQGVFFYLTSLKRKLLRHF